MSFTYVFAWWHLPVALFAGLGVLALREGARSPKGYFDIAGPMFTAFGLLLILVALAFFAGRCSV